MDEFFDSLDALKDADLIEGLEAARDDLKDAAMGPLDILVAGLIHQAAKRIAQRPVDESGD